MKRVGVIGGGRMGSGIALAFVGADYDVVVIERDDTEVAAAQQRFVKMLERLPSGTMSDIATQVSFRPGVASLPRGSDVVIESVSENHALKCEVLSAASALVDGEALIASNTSALSIGKLARAVKDPRRFLGMHFFNPVPVSDLVEVVVGELSDEVQTQRASGIVSELGKEAIIARDTPGFVTSRLGILLGMEAIRMLEDGVATAEDIDKGMHLGYRHATGPLKSTDLVGLDVRLAVADDLSRRLGARFEPPQLLRDMVARGDLGRKSGRGFYEW
jgi:3-hydroxybutyryl-CoA dehydrogenase